MPKYTFICEKCGISTEKYTPALVKTIHCSSCGEDVQMHRQIPQISGPAEVKELVDSYIGVHLPPDHKDQLDERKLDHFWTEMVPRLVNQYPPAHSLAEGWAYIDEKGQFKVHTKPPHKR